MKVKNLSIYLLTALTLGIMTACSDSSTDNPNPDPNPGGGDNNDEYVFGVDGGHTSCNKLLFDSKGNADKNANYIGNGVQNFVFKGNQTLPKGTYHLKGWIYVADGSTLTIEPGTIIKGDKVTKIALIVERGGKHMAEGTSTEPIVFPSNEANGKRKPGDWGGLIICGKAPNNQNNDQQIEGGPRSHHGGTAENDNSGIIKYVRVEFAG